MSVNLSKHKRCKFFRAKSPYHGSVFGGDATADLNIDNLATCWCVKTQGPAAPDHGYVDPSRCVTGRGCFVMPGD